MNGPGAPDSGVGPAVANVQTLMYHILSIGIAGNNPQLHGGTGTGWVNEGTSTVHTRRSQFSSRDGYCRPCLFILL